MHEDKCIACSLFNLSCFLRPNVSLPKIDKLINSFNKISFPFTLQFISCINNFLLGKKENYFLPMFTCTKDSSIKSFKEMFNRSVKQLYIVVLGVLATILIFTNDKNPKNTIFRSLIFFIGISFIVVSEINSEFLNLSLMNNLIFILLPLIIFIFTYMVIFELNKRNI